MQTYPSDDDRLDQARERMTALAVSLTQAFSPMDVAGMLAGAAIGVVASTYGRAKAVEYFTEIACELSVPEGTPEGHPNGN